MKITSTVFRKNVKKKKSFYSTGIGAVTTPRNNINVLQETITDAPDLLLNNIPNNCYK